MDKINVSRNKYKTILLFSTHARGKWEKKWQVAILRELWDTLNNKLALAEFMDNMCFA